MRRKHKRAEERAKIRDLDPDDIVLYDTVFPEHAGAGPEELTVERVEVDDLDASVWFKELESPVSFDSPDITIGMEQRAFPKEDPEEKRMASNWYTKRQAHEASVQLEDIDQLFEQWGDGHREAHDGFVAWVWDLREQSLQDLKSRDYDGLVHDISYTLRQKPEFRNIEALVAESVAREWLREHEDELILALEGSLREDRTASLKDSLIKLGNQRKDLRKHLRPVLDVVTSSDDYGERYKEEVRQQVEEHASQVMRSRSHLVHSLQDLSRVMKGTPHHQEIEGLIDELKQITRQRDPVSLAHGVATRMKSARQKNASYEQTVQYYKDDYIDKLVGEEIRVRWSRDGVLLEQIKGGRHRNWMHARYGYLGGVQHFDPFIPQNLIEWANISKGDSYDRAAEKIRQALERAIEETLNAYDVEEDDLRRNLHITEDTVYFTKVAPGSDEPIVADGRDFSVEVTWTDFKAYDPSADLHDNDPSYTLYKAKSATQARKLYKILDSNPDALANVEWNDFGDWLDRNNIKYDTQFSVWR